MTDEPAPWSTLTPEQKQTAVRELVEHRHKTYGQAALLLGVRRNVIAGVVERSRRSASPIVSQSGQGNSAVKRRRPNGVKPARKAIPKAAAAPKKPKHAGFHKFVALALSPVAVIERAPPGDVWLALPGTTPVALEDCIGCKFPIGADRPFLFCDAPVRPGGPYCMDHYALAFRELPPAKHRKETA